MKGTEKGVPLELLTHAQKSKGPIFSLLALNINLFQLITSPRDEFVPFSIELG
jgi:hypothetical protein